MNESWIPVKGYEGHYEVSDLGRVKSVARTVPHSRCGTQFIKEKILAIKLDGAKRPIVGLSKNGIVITKKVCHLVLTSFVEDRPDGLECCHGDGNPQNNTLVNLRWDTRSENTLDQVRHGTHHYVRKTHCPQNHELKHPNLSSHFLKKGIRSCRTCHCGRSAEARAKNTNKYFDFTDFCNKFYENIMSDAQ